jgi:ditrans,polycis-polyprenyl diphosphate synthase
MDTWIWRFPGMQNVLGYCKNLLINILKTGSVPKHVAFVMDGNRRYARQRNQEVAEGHNAGFDSLSKILEMCYAVGVEVVTIYAFSIENFNRTPFEVKNLMELTKSKLLQVTEHGDMAHRLGIRIKIIGDKSRLPPDVLEAADRAEEVTRDNNKAILNICLPYTSRDEIARAIRTVVGKCENNEIYPSQIDEDVLEDYMYTAGDAKLDILVRTSGVQRFSDFMLWQSHQGATIEFQSVLWPEFGFWHLYLILLRWSMKQSAAME